MRVAVCAFALAGLSALGACASNHHDMAYTGSTMPAAAYEPAPPPPAAYAPPPPMQPAPPPAPVRAGERG